MHSDHASIEYDPNLLIGNAVPSKKNWLPSAALLGTIVTIDVDLPKRLLASSRRR